MKYANLQLACSKEAGEWLFGNTQFIVLNNGIDVSKYVFNQNIREEYRKILGFSDELVLGHVGRFSNQKNHNFLIDIFYEIIKINKKSKLILIGTGELENEIKEKVESLSLKEKVIFLGARADVNKIMQAMDVFILPSLFEGLPVVGVEAQASGLPCIISDTVSKDVKITDSVLQISLSLPPEEWGKKLIDFYETFERKDMIV